MNAPVAYAHGEWVVVKLHDDVFMRIPSEQAFLMADAFAGQARDLFAAAQQARGVKENDCVGAA